MSTYKYHIFFNNVILFMLIGIISVLSFACANDNYEVDESRNETILVLNGGIDLYDAPPIHKNITTRATSSDWENGARIYVQFKVSSGNISGVATYNKTQGVWAISLDGELSQGQTGSCVAYYFENASSIADTSVDLHPESAIYEDTHATYSYNDGVIDMQAHLTPMTGRVRFSGASGSTIKISGLMYFQSYSINGNKLTPSEEALSLTIGSSGYTPYIYVDFADTNRELTIQTSEGSFYKYFASSVLSRGQSGYIRIPTKTFMSGWSLVKSDIKLPYVSPDYSDPTWSNGSSICCFDSKGNGGNYSYKGYRLAHTNVGNPSVRGAGLTSSYTRVINTTECGECSIAIVNCHLFTDADETVFGEGSGLTAVILEDQPLVSALNSDPSTTTAQDIADCYSTINLSKLVEVHSHNGSTERALSSSELRNNGFEIRFELTGLKLEGSSISESAYAAIQINERGEYILRPQLPSNGRSASYGQTQQSETTV